ncbi:hypothetical protein [Hyphococcus sp.]|uniref:hypothetical protein n=1 Tax=Hyphococcus sp. TaxID=2038636 RepID=UPI0035C6C443
MSRNFEKPDAPSAPDAAEAQVADARKLQRVTDELRSELSAEKLFVQQVMAENDRLKELIAKLHHALEPRISSILTLRPLRFALAERNRIKAEVRRKGRGSEDTVGQLIEARKHEYSTAADIVERVRETARSHDAQPGRTAAGDVGIAVYAHDRAHFVSNVLHALDLQGASGLVHVWIDGDHGNAGKRVRVDLVHDCVQMFPVKAVHRNRGNFGFRKMMLLSMRYMMERYDKIVFLEDDCFPVGGAVDGFSRALDAIVDKPDVFSVYGHPFGLANEEKGVARFQGWGWATTSEKLRPVWDRLMDCYLKTEEEYLDFVRSVLTPDIQAQIDITPGRLPSDTLTKFFAWDETLCLLTALRGMRHQRTDKRLIYNFGAGADAAHFHDIDYFREPPFNMVSMDEIWAHY